MFEVKHDLFLCYSSSSDIHFDSERLSYMKDCLDAVNGLVDLLHEKMLLDEQECSDLTKESSYVKSAEKLMEKIGPKLSSKLNQEMFLNALIETDQKHIYNYLTHIDGMGNEIRS